jgi:hypothetical protein
MRARRARIRALVLPGQPHEQARFMGLSEAFTRQPVNGVIHLVSNGFAETRDQATVDRLRADGIDTLDKYRDHIRALELEAFKQLCTRIQESHANHRMPKWMVIATSKFESILQ